MMDAKEFKKFEKELVRPPGGDKGGVSHNTGQLMAMFGRAGAVHGPRPTGGEATADGG